MARQNQSTFGADSDFALLQALEIPARSVELAENPQGVFPVLIDFETVLLELVSQRSLERIPSVLRGTAGRNWVPPFKPEHSASTRTSCP